MARCRSCPTEIVFAVTAAGKRIPLDAVPNPDGNVELIDGLAVVHGQVPMMHGELWMPHFATCPEGAAWSAGERFDGATYEPVEDKQRLTAHMDRLAQLTDDGRWWTLAALARVVGCTEASASARLRDLRKPRFGEHVVERRRIEGGLYEYRVLAHDHREPKRPIKIPGPRELNE